MKTKSKVDATTLDFGDKVFSIRLCGLGVKGRSTKRTKVVVVELRGKALKVFRAAKRAENKP